MRGKYSIVVALEGVPEGSRDVTLFRLAESLHRAGVPMTTDYRLLRSREEGDDGDLGHLPSCYVV